MRRDCSNAKSRLHWQIVAKREFKAEFFMTHRDMRKYWEDRHAPLYGPLSLMSRWLRMRRGARRA